MKNEYIYQFNQYTSRRFAEIEIFHTFERLNEVMSGEQTYRVFDVLGLNVRDMMLGPGNRPSKYETVACYRAQGMSQLEMQQRFQISPNTILKHSKAFFHEEPQPVIFPRQHTLVDEDFKKKWERAKQIINCFSHINVKEFR